MYADIKSYKVGDLVNIKNFSVGSKWLPGIIMQITGPLSYMIKLTDGRTLKRHVDHVLPRASDQEGPENLEHNFQSQAHAVPCIQPSLEAESNFQSLPQALQGPVVAGGPAVTSDLTSALPLEVATPPSEVFQPPDVMRPNPGNLAPEVTPTASSTSLAEGRPVRQRRLPERLKDFVIQWGRDELK